MKRCLAILCVLTCARVARADDEPFITCHPAGGKIRIQFKPESSIVDLTVWAMGFSCKNVIFGADVARLAPKVTVLAPNDLTPKQALQLYVDAVEAAGLVVVQKQDTIILKLGPNTPRSCPDVAVASAPAPPVREPEPPTPNPCDPFNAMHGCGAAPSSLLPPTVDDLDAQIDVGIRKLDDTHFEIKRPLLDAILANPMAVAKGARVVPSVKDGKPNGFKLYAIRPSSVYARLGFINSDTLVRINGDDLTSADKALEIYTKVRDAKQLVVEIVRRGTPVTLTITVTN